MNSSKSNMKTVLVFCFAVICFLLVGNINAEASMKQMKFYKEAFPGTKPKCLSCHTAKMPKKGEGEHDLNAYGLKAQEADGDLSGETYKTIGSIEDFEMQGGEVVEEMMDEEKVELDETQGELMKEKE